MHLDHEIIGTYVFTATRKTLFIYYNRDFFDENASFRHLLASMPLTTPKPQNTDTNGIHASLILAILTKNASFRSLIVLLRAHILNIIEV